MPLLEHQRQLVEDYLASHDRIRREDARDGISPSAFGVNAVYRPHAWKHDAGELDGGHVSGVVRHLRPVLMMYPLEPRGVTPGAYDRILWAHIGVRSPDASIGDVTFVAPFATSLFFRDADPYGLSNRDSPFFFLPLVRAAFAVQRVEGRYEISSPEYLCPLHERCSCVVRRRSVSLPRYGGSVRPDHTAPVADRDPMVWVQSLVPLLQLEVNREQLVSWCFAPPAGSRRELADLLFTLFYPTTTGLLLVRIEPIGEAAQPMPWLLTVPDDPDPDYLVQEWKTFLREENESRGK